MKYLFIFLPIFCFGQDTIVRGLDTLIIGRSYYDNPSFYKEWTRIGKHKDFTKVGDKVIVTKNLNGHRFEIGEIVELSYKFPGENSWKCTGKDDWWHLTEEEFKILNQ